MNNISICVLVLVYGCVCSFIYLSVKADKENRQKNQKEAIDKYLKWKAHIIAWIDKQKYMTESEKENYLKDRFYEFLTKNISIEYYDQLEEDFHKLLRSTYAY